MFKSIQLEVTGQCPFACSHCSVNAGPGRTYAVPLSSATRLIALAAAVGVKRMVFTGGEPLGYPHLLALLESCAERRLRGEVYTMAVDATGMPTTADTAIALAPLVARWWVSIHGAPQIHDRITGSQGSLSRTLLGVDRFIAAGSDVAATMVISSAGLEQISTVASICREHHISELRIFTVVNQGRAAAMGANTIAATELIARAADASRKSGIRVRVGTSAAADLGFADTCCGATEELVVNPAGWISPCHAVEPHPSASDLDNVFLSGPKAVFERSPRLLAVRAEAARRTDAGERAGCVTRGIYDAPYAFGRSPIRVTGRTAPMSRMSEIVSTLPV
jgi:MoaA/NifB/PqqE/SkfB family radical SAM enzyme